MDVELREIRDFLARHAPYCDLTPATLDSLPAKLTLRYFRRGSTIVDVGAGNNSLFVLRSGAVDILWDGRELVERVEEGATFGTATVLSAGPSADLILALEDSLVLVMPAAVLHDLMATEPAMADFFSAGDSRVMKQAVAELHDSAGRVILQTRVADLVQRDPITAPTQLSIRAAAQVMTDHRVSALVLMDGAAIRGIVTDRDLRSKVVAAGRNVDDSVADIMTSEPRTIASTALAVDALLEMLTLGVHHLPVVDDDRLIGLVSSGDLMRLETANPVFLVGDIAKQQSAAGLAKVTSRLPQLVARLVDQDASADVIHRLITAVSDATTRRLLALAEADLGTPPVAYEWLVLGSQGRYEHGLGSDQDHVLLLDDAATPDDDAYFAALAEHVTAGLEQCGYPRCPGEVMATNPRWRKTEGAWREEFHAWLLEPVADAVLAAQIFFDFRSVSADTARSDALREDIRSRAGAARRFLGHLAAQAVGRQQPIGFFRGLVMERGGRSQDTFDLKASVHTIVELARTLALANGVTAVNTIERLHAVTSAGALSPDSEDGLIDAFELITYLQLRHQARRVTAGHRPDNLVAPAELSAREKKHLRDVFAAIKRAQSGFAYRYQTHLMA